MWRWLADVDPRDQAVTRLFDRLIAAGTALDPTLVLFAARPGALGDDVGDTSMDDPERTPLLPALPDRVREELIGRWAERRRAAAGVSPRGADRMRKGWEHLLALVDRFHRAGGTVLAGTDCPNVAIVAGFSLHREPQLRCAPASRRWTRCWPRPAVRPHGSIAGTSSARSPPASPPTWSSSTLIPSPTSGTSGASTASSPAGRVHDPQYHRDTRRAHSAPRRTDAPQPQRDHMEVWAA